MSFIIVIKIALLIAAVGANGLLLSYLRDPLEDLIYDIKHKECLYALSDFGKILVIIGGYVLVTAFMVYLIFG